MKRSFLSNRSRSVATWRGSLRRLAVAAVVLSAPAFLGLQPARAETQIYRDILRPHGVERSLAQKFADGRSCGSTPQNTFTNAAAFQACMRKRGWVLDHVVQDVAPSTWIDPDTGMECRSAGIGQICTPPQGTVTYTNKHGYPCRRTGIISVCGSI
jgi:hypothetical protein